MSETRKHEAPDYGIQAFPEGASKTIFGTRYDAEGKFLYVQFFRSKKPGPIYKYANVEPDLYAQMLEAPSIGGFFTNHIRARPQVYTYVLVWPITGDEPDGAKS